MDSSGRHHMDGSSKKWFNLKILSISEVINLELCKIGYKVVNKILPKQILKLLETDANLKNLEKKHRYNTRNKSIQNLPKVKGKKYSWSYLCLSIKNIQPLLFITRKSRNLPHFVKLFKECLFATGDNSLFS